MTTVRTISYEVSGELPYGPQGLTSYAGVQLNGNDPEELRRFLDRAAASGFGSTAHQYRSEPQAQQQPQQQPGNYFSPPSISTSSRQAIAAQAATLGRARSLSPTLQQSQQFEANHNYLRRNYQPTWVDTIDEIYKPDAEESIETVAPRIAYSYTRRYDIVPATGQQHHSQYQWSNNVQQYDKPHDEQQNFDSRHQTQPSGQCCQHCPGRNDAQPLSDDSAVGVKAASLSPRKNYRFIYQQEQPTQPLHQQQQQQQQKSDENWSAQQNIVSGRTQSQPPSSLLQYASVPSCTQCQNCGCQAHQSQQQNWHEQQCVVQPIQEELQNWQQQKSQQSPKKQQHNTFEEGRVNSTTQYQQNQIQSQHQQHFHHQQPAPQKSKEPQSYDVVVHHDEQQQRKQEQPQEQQKQQHFRQPQQHGIGYYQMLKQQQQQQIKGKHLLDSPIQKPQQHQQQQQHKNYYTEHRQEYTPTQNHIEHQPQQKQQHVHEHHHQFNQPEQPISQVYYPQQEYSGNNQQQYQQQFAYQHHEEQQKQYVHQEPHDTDINHYDENIQQQQRARNASEQLQHNKSTVVIGRPQYLGHKPKSNHLYFSPRGTAEEESTPQQIFTTVFSDGRPMTVSYRQLARRTQSEDPRRHHSPVPGASERGYQYGGMDFVDHNGPLPFRPDDFLQAGGSSAAHARKSREELPLRRPGDHYGLDYSVHPAAASLSPSREDAEWYHGYAPRVPRQHWKFSADPAGASLNNYEVATWDQVDPTGLVGDTLSNQKIESEPPLSEQEKNQFCVEFAPPVGFRPEHRTVITVPAEPEPICMSLSAKKDKLKNATSSTPAAQSQNQYNANVWTNHPLNSTQDASWYANGNKEVMRREPNWSRNVVLRKQAWEDEKFGSENTRPSWARSAPIQKQQQPHQKESTLHHNEQQRMTRSAHWVKQQENEQKEQQPVRQHNEIEKVQLQLQRQQQQPQHYPKHPQHQYAHEWQLSGQNQRYLLQQQQQKQHDVTNEEQQPDDNDVDVVIEEVEVDQIDFDQQQHEQQIICTRYQSGGQLLGNRNLTIQNANPSSKGQSVGGTHIPPQTINGNVGRQPKEAAGVRQQINRNEFVS